MKTRVNRDRRAMCLIAARIYRAFLLHFRAGMYKRNTTLALVLVTLVATGCGSAGGAGDFNLISIEEEWQLGAQLSQDPPAGCAGGGGYRLSSAATSRVAFAFLNDTRLTVG